MPNKMVRKRAFGSTLGGLLGGLGSAFMPIPGLDGRALGSFLGGMTGLKRGGVRRKKVAKKARGGRK